MNKFRFSMGTVISLRRAGGDHHCFYAKKNEEEIT
jgi:hypothetical protein